MGSLNRCQFIGNLGSDPELKHTPSGKAVANFSLACNESFKDASGTKQERVEWVRCTAWDKTAELAAKFLSKGRQVYVEGRMQTRKYEKDGVEKFSTEIVVSNVVFLGKADGAAERTPAPAGDDGEV